MAIDQLRQLFEVTSVATSVGEIPEDVDLLVDISNNMMGNTICAFADGTAMPMLGFIQKFLEEFIDAARNGLPAEVRHDDSVRSIVERVA